MKINIENIVINVVLPAESREAPKPALEHRSSANELLKTQLRRECTASKLIQAKNRIADKIRAMFGDECANQFLAGGL